MRVMSMSSYAETGRVAEELRMGCEFRKEEVTTTRRGCCSEYTGRVSMVGTDFIFSTELGLSSYEYESTFCELALPFYQIRYPFREKCNIVDASIRSERCHRNSKILLTLHYEIYMIDLHVVRIKIQECVDHFNCQSI